MPGITQPGRRQPSLDSTTDAYNGLLNRFLFIAARRARSLPHGGDADAVTEAISNYSGDLREALTWAQNDRKIAHDRMAYELWGREYEALSTEHPGLFGALTARAEAQVSRLALVYALLDCSTAVMPAHLRAALALWRYSEASVRHIFGDRLGDPVADTVLEALRARGEEGMTRTEVSELLGRNVSSTRIATALRALVAAHLAVCATEATGEKGRPTERWFALNKA